jgi:hypothetical protein
MFNERRNVKKNLVFLFLSLLSVFASAQDKELLPFSFGPAVGTNVSRLSTKIEDPLISNFKTRDIISFHGGMFARIHYHKLYFQPELLVFVKGGKCTYDILLTDPGNPASMINTGITQTIKTTSLDIPLLIGYTFGRSLLNFRIFAGPQGTYILDGKVKVSSDNIDLPEEGKLKVKKLAWSMTGGIGMDLWRFFIDARYERGLNNISANTSFKQYPSSFVLTIGWKTF